MLPLATALTLLILQKLPHTTTAGQTPPPDKTTRARTRPLPHPRRRHRPIPPPTLATPLPTNTPPPLPHPTTVEEAGVSCLRSSDRGTHRCGEGRSGPSRPCRKQRGGKLLPSKPRQIPVSGGVRDQLQPLLLPLHAAPPAGGDRGRRPRDREGHPPHAGRGYRGTGLRSECRQVGGSADVLARSASVSYVGTCVYLPTLTTISPWESRA